LLRYMASKAVLVVMTLNVPAHFLKKLKNDQTKAFSVVMFALALRQHPRG
jgi:hypothetical protein